MINLVRFFVVLLIGGWLTGCSSIDDNFPVPEASIVPVFETEVLNDETREVRFINKSIIPDNVGQVTYNWSFGDGTSSTEESPTHSYEAYGEYDVKLVVIAASSSKIVETQDDLALLQPINIDFTLYYMDVNLLTIEGVGTSTTTKQLNGFGSGLAIDQEGQFLYYSDDDNLQIKRYSIENAEQEILFEGLTAAGNVALDVENNKVYWTNRAEGAVYRGNMDGSGEAEAIITSLSLPEGIAIHNGKLYVSDVDIPPVGENIYRANLNGSNLEIFVAGSWGYALAIDSTNQRLYFGDQGVYDDPNDNRIKYVDLNDNSSIQTIAALEAIGDNGSRSYGIAINETEGKVYWSDRSSAKIKNSDLDGSNVSTILVADGQPRGIALDY